MASKFNEREEHTLMVKGIGYREQFGSGAGGFTFTIEEYARCSLNWVLQIDWQTLNIKGISTCSTKTTH